MKHNNRWGTDKIVTNNPRAQVQGNKDFSMIRTMDGRVAFGDGNNAHYPNEPTEAEMYESVYEAEAD